LATRIGRAVPVEFEGAVRAVWRRACAIAPDPATRAEWGVALVTLVREDVPMTAASVELQVGAAFDFAASGIRAGDRVRCDGSTIVVRPARSNEPIEADLRGAVFYDGFVPEMPRPVDPSLLEPLAVAARRHRSAMCGGSVLGVTSSDACDVLLRRLSLSASAGDDLAAERAARSLLGLGPGLTPSGDDALCGFMLGRRLSGGGVGATDAALKRVASGAARLTSEVSAVQLELAARERFGEALLDVAAALYAGYAPLVSAAVARCLAEGATSGADGLLGLAAGVRTRGPLCAGAGVSLRSH
jgi:hypothetical protein